MKPDVSPDKAALVRVALDQVKAGQTIPAEEVEAWIESWDTADELPKPKPRKR
jgi:predicted transcriptional regulator